VSPHRASYYRSIEAVLVATRELLDEQGIRNVTLAAIAERTGITRQWLHELFPDLHSIFSLLYQQIKSEYLRLDQPLPIERDERIAFLSAEALRWLGMPVAYATLGTYILNGSARTSLQGSELRNELIEDLSRAWIDPFLGGGHQRDNIVAGINVMLNTLFGLVIAVNDGLTTRAAAETRMLAVIEALGRVPL
jgi:AcrR family transcriptional regulator